VAVAEQMSYWLSIKNHGWWLAGSSHQNFGLLLKNEVTKF